MDSLFGQAPTFCIAWRRYAIILGELTALRRLGALGNGGQAKPPGALFGGLLAGSIGPSGEAPWASGSTRTVEKARAATMSH